MGRSPAFPNGCADAHLEIEVRVEGGENARRVAFQAEFLDDRVAGEVFDFEAVVTGEETGGAEGADVDGGFDDGLVAGLGGVRDIAELFQEDEGIAFVANEVAELGSEASAWPGGGEEGGDFRKCLAGGAPGAGSGARAGAGFAEGDKALDGSFGGGAKAFDGKGIDGEEVELTGGGNAVDGGETFGEAVDFATGGDSPYVVDVHVGHEPEEAADGFRFARAADSGDGDPEGDIDFGDSELTVPGGCADDGAAHIAVGKHDTIHGGAVAFVGVRRGDGIEVAVTEAIEGLPVGTEHEAIAAALVHVIGRRKGLRRPEFDEGRFRH